MGILFNFVKNMIFRGTLIILIILILPRSVSHTIDSDSASNPKPVADHPPTHEQTAVPMSTSSKPTLDEGKTVSLKTARKRVSSSYLSDRRIGNGTFQSLSYFAINPSASNEEITNTIFRHINNKLVLSGYNYLERNEDDEQLIKEIVHILTSTPSYDRYNSTYRLPNGTLIQDYVKDRGVDNVSGMWGGQIWISDGQWNDKFPVEDVVWDYIVAWESLWKKQPITDL